MKKSALLLIFFAPIYLQSQIISPAELQEKLAAYEKNNNRTQLYLHIDKTTYTNTENIWFSAYVLSNPVPKDSLITLYIALQNLQTKAISLQESFALQDNHTAGALFLPDSMPAGKYRLLAYTGNIYNNKQDDVFQQEIIIKRNKLTSLFIDVSYSNENDLLKTTVKITDNVNAFIKNAECQYTAYNATGILETGKTKTDGFGEFSFMLKKDEAVGKVYVKLVVNYDKQVQENTIRIPVPSNNLLVKIFPEGGWLIHTIKQLVYIECKNTGLEAVATEFEVLENGKRITSFTTDEFGMGVFSIAPDETKQYSIVPVNSKYSKTVVALPKILPDGFAMHIDNTLADDTLHVKLMQYNNPGKAYLILHNYKDLFVHQAIDLDRDVLKIKIPLKDVPKGLMTATLLDEDGKPWAENLFFAHHDRKIKVNITTDKQEYGTREKVTLKLKFTDEKDNPAYTQFSFSCTEQQRLSPLLFTDLPTYNYLGYHLTNDLPYTGMNSFQQKSKMPVFEKILNTRYWRRYSWPDLLKTNTYTNEGIVKCDDGYVNRNGRHINKIVSIMVIGKAGMKEINTDDEGYFTIPDEYKVTPDGKKLLLIIDDKKKEDLGFTMLNCDTAATTVAKINLFESRDTLANSFSSKTTVVSNFNQAKTLTAVVIKAKKNDDFSVKGDIYRSSNCFDFVCVNNVLNCQNHPNSSSKPENGNFYLYRDRLSGELRTVKYFGCKDQADTVTYMAKIKGINLPKQFYVADYEKFSPPDADYVSTIYWHPGLLTNLNGEATCTFFTSDITGKFICVVEGKALTDVAHGEKTFTVKEKQ